MCSVIKRIQCGPRNALFKLKCFCAALVMALSAMSLTMSMSYTFPAWYFDVKSLPTEDVDVLPNRSVVETQHHRSWPPVQHVYFLKTHKTGSSTIYAIMAEYSRSHRLRPLLPASSHINQKVPLIPEEQLMLDPHVKHYDMVFNHHVYDPAIFTYLHNDTFKFTTLREPFQHFVSSFTYFKKVEHMEYLTVLNKEKDPISTFLSDPSRFEATGYSSYTNNRQSIDLGYEIYNHSFSDENYIQAFIKETEKRFDLILITEYFLESIVLLKRALHWRTQDVIYTVKNAFKESKLVLANMTEWHREQHRKFSLPDIKLYQHFLSLFKLRMSQTVGLEQEASELKDILQQVQKFCSLKDETVLKDENNVQLTKLEIPAGRWSDQVSIFTSKCIWLNLQEEVFTKHLKTLQS